MRVEERANKEWLWGGGVRGAGYGGGGSKLSR